MNPGILIIVAVSAAPLIIAVALFRALGKAPRLALDIVGRLLDRVVTLYDRVLR